MTQDALAQLDDVLSELEMGAVLDALLDNYDVLPVIAHLVRKGGFSPMLKAMATTAGDMKKESMGRPHASASYVRIKNILEYTANNVLSSENHILQHGGAKAVNRQPHPPPKRTVEKVTPDPAGRPTSELNPGALRTRAAIAEGRSGRAPGRPKGSKNKTKKETSDA